jgi:signal transduction histidine kinase
VDILRRVNTSARELFELITATLDMSRLESGRFAVQRSDVSLDVLLRELAVEMREPHETPSVTFSWHIPAGLPTLCTDRLKLKVVLKNLIANALKFTPEGGVSVSATARDGGVEIAVRDTGIGIAAEAQSIIFEPFRQADSSATRRYGGVGLGLYVVRRLVDLLDGRVSVDSVLGKGSTFHVWLPERQPTGD